MNIARRFEQYAADFELTKQDGDWSRVEEHFHPDAKRREVIPPLLNIEIEGRRNLIAQWKEMIENFDLRFPYRFVQPLGQAKADGDMVELRWVGVYAIDGAPALFGEGTEFAVYRDGHIVCLETTMTEETVQRNLEWYSTYSEMLDSKLLEYALTLAGRTTSEE